MTKCRCAHGLSWFRTCPACQRERADLNQERFHLACLAVRRAECVPPAWDSDERAPIERRLRDRRAGYETRRSGNPRRAADGPRVSIDGFAEYWYRPLRPLIYED
jgi:hypothetical protein